MPAVTPAVARLVEALLSLRPLVDALEQPFDLSWAPAASQAGADHRCLTPQELVIHVARRLGISTTERLPGEVARPSIFHDIVSRRLAGEWDAAALGVVPKEALPDVDAIVDGVVSASFIGRCLESPLRSADGARLRVYGSGAPGARAIVLVSACGMPAALCERWMAALAPHRVVTWETRGLFDASSGAEFDAIAHDVDAQARDLLAVMDHAGVRSAHVMGFCGGAVVALVAAALDAQRIDSLSLWHGDYELGARCPQTAHQANIRALLRIAAASRPSAASVREVFCQSVRQRPDSGPVGARPELAHVLLYPFTTAELLFRYARLNGAIMDRDVSDLLASIVQPALVVTSDDDETAHPAGSRWVAARLRHARLHVTQHGNHISAFDAPGSAVELVEGFIAERADRPVPLYGRELS